MHIYIREIHHRTTRLYQIDCFRQTPAQRAKQSQRHHRGSMDSRGTMDEQFRFRFVQSGLCESYSPLKHTGIFRLEVVVNGIPKDLDTMRLCQAGIVELDLHVQNVRDSGARNFGHVGGIPYASAHRNARCNPCHIHPATLVPKLACVRQACEAGPPRDHFKVPSKGIGALTSWRCSPSALGEFSSGRPNLRHSTCARERSPASPSSTWTG